MKNYKDSFPIFKKYPDLIYLDTAATCQRPQEVIDAISEFYSTYNSNIGRGSYDLADKAQTVYNESKKTVADFFGVSPKQTIFTYGATDGLNQSSQMLHHIFNKEFSHKKYIVISALEHHSNILPWLELCEKTGLQTFFCNIEESFNPNKIPEHILKDTFIFTCTHVSNVTGEILPVMEWSAIAKQYNAFLVIDGSQAVGSFRVKIDKIESDFYIFSSHKMYGPMGAGVMIVSERILNLKPTPARLGGGIVEDVPTSTRDNRIYLEANYSLIDGIDAYEAGTPNLANIYAIAESIRWMLGYQWYNAITYMNVLSKYLYKRLSEEGFEPIKSSPDSTQTHIAAFNIPGVHSHDMGTFLHKKNIAARTGKHCAYPLYDTLGINSSVRLSIGLYNTHSDIDTAIAQIKEAVSFFGKNNI